MSFQTQNTNQNSPDVPVTTGASIREATQLGLVLFPSLNSEEVSSTLVAVKDYQVIYNRTKKEVEISFKIDRKPPQLGASSFRWLLILHGEDGLRVFPSALTSGKENLLDIQKGYQVDDVKTDRKISAAFALGEFISSFELKTVKSTLLLFDEKGALLVRRQADLERQN